MVPMLPIALLRIKKRFIACNAVDEKSALTLSELGIRRERVLRPMIHSGRVVVVDGNKYYMREK